MKFIDTHTHLFASEFNDDIDIVVKNAINSGVSKMLLPNIDSSTTNNMLQLCNKYPQHCFPMIGLHPCSVKKDNIDKEILHVEEMLNKNKFIAIGEIGLDLYWDKSTLSYQKVAFESQIKLAKKYQLPIVIHVRDSFNEAIEIVEKLNNENLSGVFIVSLVIFKKPKE
jgi:TatD DNase family protein